ncbi:MAG: MXAN_5187 family protein [Myxococcota bacterium]
MLLSRFWYALLVAIAAIAAMFFLLIQASFNRQYDKSLQDQLSRDRDELGLILRVDARMQLDSISGFAAHGDVRQKLRAASGRNAGTEINEELREPLTQTLTRLNAQLEAGAGELVFAVDRAGTIVAAIGVDPIPENSSLGAFPLVERALAGFVRDDVWVWNEKVYRMAARPVIDGGQYVGAIVHGKEVNNAFAERISRAIGATIAFYEGDRILASHMPTEGGFRAEEIGAPLAELVASEAFQAGDPSEPTDIAGARGRAIFVPLQGSAAYSRVGYAVGRPRTVLTSVGDLIDQVTLDDLSSLSGLSTAMLIVLPILGFLLAMLWVFIERDRPLGKFTAAALELGEGKAERLKPAGFSRRYRKIGEAINQALDRMAETGGGAGAARKPADLDEILGSTSGESQAPSFFGFAEGESAPPEIPSIPAAPAAPALGGIPKTPGVPAEFAKTSPDAPQPDLAAVGAATGKPVLPEPPPAVPKGPPPVAAPAPPAAAPNPAAAPLPPAPPAKKPAWAKGTLVGVGMDGPAAGAGPLQASAASSALDSLPPLGAGLDDDDDDDGATMVANVPQELLDAAGGPEPDAEQEVDRHFREVFEQFVATKKQCGEPTQGLTFEKFGQTLRKNRDQIISKHGAKSVKFTVYVKEGKAALKATPVKA